MRGRVLQASAGASKRPIGTERVHPILTDAFVESNSLRGVEKSMLPSFADVFDRTHRKKCVYFDCDSTEVVPRMTTSSHSPKSSKDPRPICPHVNSRLWVTICGLSMSSK
ncbi:hypothetical protein Poly24_18700 [Rosistilla carotiformis]|uniref:Uncharacterized protein n=1 Tax=Rosistilla carotiformis TaxID=2528017 RepID=A0A518JRJ7_9BACT|nr:hypothetical protein Poly24_18700 [Rosistilla carotiformis]